MVKKVLNFDSNGSLVSC